MQHGAHRPFQDDRRPIVRPRSPPHSWLSGHPATGRGGARSHNTIRRADRHARIRKVSPVQTKLGAEEYERQLRAELLHPTPEVKEVPTFEQFVNERGLPVYPGAAGNRHSTIIEREGHLRIHLRAVFGKMRIDAIGREDIARFYAEMTKKGLSPKSQA